MSFKVVEDDSDLARALEVRREVFVDEQGISRNEEFDGLDGDAMHIVAKDGDRAIGTARVRFPDAKLAKLERMAILAPFRRRGIGTGMVSFVIKELKDRQVERVVLHAQCRAMGFYEACGFEKYGLPFWEAGIEHINMERQL